MKESQKIIGDPVTYKPCKGDVNHSVEHGTISSFNESYLFVRYRSACGKLRRTISMGIIPAQNKIQPTSNEQRNYTSSGTNSRRKIFYTTERSRRMSIYLLGILFRTATESTQIGWKNILKPEYFGIKNNSKTSCKTFD
jgi:hypothetical protein